MTEFIVDVPDKDAELFIARFGLEGTTLMGYHLMGEIVRCRDCEWFTPEYFYEEERGFGVVEILSDPPDCGNPERCSHHYDSFTKKTVPVHIVTDPDGFCAWAVKREEGGDAE